MNIDTGSKKQFALALEPMDYQLTVHYHNYNNQLTASFEDDFLYVSTFIDNEVVQKEKPAMYNFIRYYGSEKIMQWIETFIVRNVA